MSKKKKKKYNLKGKIINTLRNLSKKHPQRKAVEDRTKVDSATFSCERCGIWLYKGTSEKNFLALQEKHPDKKIIKGKLQVDHQVCAISLDKGWKFSYDDYIARLFCGEEKLSGLCHDCHTEKTNLEKVIRKEKAGTKELEEAWEIYKKFLEEYL